MLKAWVKGSGMVFPIQNMATEKSEWCSYLSCCLVGHLHWLSIAIEKTELRLEIGS